MNFGQPTVTTLPQPSIRAVERQLDLTGDALVLYHSFKPIEAIAFLYEACLALKNANNELLRIVKAHEHQLTNLTRD